MPGVNLSEDQKKSVAEMANLIGKLKQWEKHERKDVERWHEELAEKAHKLHIELKEAGIEPKHHRYMILNRRVPPTDPAFYRHIHPAEDLLAFINNVHANDDKADQTIGAEFSFRIFSRRWGHDDVYKMRRIPEGWWVGYLIHAGDCDRTASPQLYKNFRQDGINYPADLPNYFAWLWEKAGEQGLSKPEVQLELDRLARWVSICEQNTPGGIFEGYSGPAVTTEAG
jgi:hypothetical protein